MDVHRIAARQKNVFSRDKKIFISQGEKNTKVSAKIINKCAGKSISSREHAAFLNHTISILLIKRVADKRIKTLESTLGKINSNLSDITKTVKQYRKAA